MQVLWAMHLELHMLQWIYEFIFIIHTPLLQSCCHMTIWTHDTLATELCNGR